MPDEHWWLTSRNPFDLRAGQVGRQSPRKTALFGAACCRLVWRLLVDPRSRAAVEAVERWADDPGDRADGQRADRLGLRGCGWAERLGERYERAARAARILGVLDQWNTVEHVLGYADEAVRLDSPGGSLLPAAADLLRDVFGNPFRPVAFAPGWRSATAVALARRMYDAREFAAMPVLADALEDAGCDSPDVLEHCRGPGPHVRGCWVVDLVLGLS